MKELTVLIINHSPLFAQLLSRFFQVEEGAHVRMVSGSGNDLLGPVRESLPDLILIDLDSGLRDRLDVITAIRKAQTGSLIIGVASSDGAVLRREVIAAGADEFIRKSELGLRFFIELHCRIIKAKRRGPSSSGRQLTAEVER